MIQTKTGRLRAARFLAGVLEAEGLRLVRIQRSRKEPLRMSRKALDDPVTVLDRQVETRIARQLRALHITDAVLGEECGRSGAQSDMVWVVDPIDGTTNFGSGIQIFALSAALLIQGKPALAICYDSRLQGTFFTIDDGPVYYKKQGSPHARKLAPIPTTGHSATRGKLDPLDILCLQWRSHPNKSPRSGVRSLSTIATEFPCKVRVFGSAVTHLLAVAVGEVVATVMDRVKIWDLAGASLIAQNAGASVLQFDGTPLLPFAVDAVMDSHRNYRIIASRPALTPVLLQKTRRLSR